MGENRYSFSSVTAIDRWLEGLEQLTVDDWQLIIIPVDMILPRVDRDIF